jgi:glucosamine kinase
MTATEPAVLAVDGGQSTVRIRHSNGAIGAATGVSWGGVDTVATTAEAILTAWRAAGAPPATVAVLGLTTVPGSRAERDRLATLIAEATGSDRILLCDDGVTAHAGVLGGSWGLVLAIGTGVACVARARDGRVTFIGGHGYLLGDEGGGYWMGRAGIAAALRAADGRGQATELTPLVEKSFGRLDTAHIRIHSDARAVDAIARFAPTVVETARRGDEVSRRIVEASIAELASCVRAGWAASGEQSPMPLAITGRLGDALSPELAATLAEFGDLIDVRQPVGDSLDGALQLSSPQAAAGYGSALHVWTRG